MQAAFPDADILTCCKQPTESLDQKPPAHLDLKMRLLGLVQASVSMWR